MSSIVVHKTSLRAEFIRGWGWKQVRTRLESNLKFRGEQLWIECGLPGWRVGVTGDR